MSIGTPHVKSGKWRVAVASACASPKEQTINGCNVQCAAMQPLLPLLGIYALRLNNSRGVGSRTLPQIARALRSMQRQEHSQAIQYIYSMKAENKMPF